MISFERHGVELLRYVETGDPQPAESPKPYLHPLRTLAGDVVTVYRPHDHRWHKGLQLTASHVSGQNFWGGGTYRHGEGYVQLDNNGTMRHDSLAVSDDGLTGTLTWRTSYGEAWVSEERSIRIARLDPDRGSWELHWHSSLTGQREEPLAFGSPTTHGRPMAGYSGLFWRGPRSFTGGRIIGPDGRGGEELMGTKARWVAFHGRHDEVDRDSTLIFVPAEDCDWFVRTEWFAAVNPSWAFHEEFALGRDETVSRSYRIIVATGAWDGDQIEKYLGEG